MNDLVLGQIASFLVKKTTNFRQCVILKGVEAKGTISYYNWELSCEDVKRNELETVCRMWHRRIWEFRVFCEKKGFSLSISPCLLEEKSIALVKKTWNWEEIKLKMCDSSSWILNNLHLLRKKKIILFLKHGGEVCRRGTRGSGHRIARVENQLTSLRNSIACFVTGNTEELWSEVMTEHWRTHTSRYATSHQIALKNKMTAFELTKYRRKESTCITGVKNSAWLTPGVPCCQDKSIPKSLEVINNNLLT